MKGQPTTFLVIEDNDLDVEKITRGFKRLNVANEIINAKNGYVALDMLRGTNGRKKLIPPFIILLDLNMPKMNGFEFLRELRADANIAHAPVFVLTTSDREKDVSAAYEFNVCGYIVKPVALEKMFEALATLNMYWKLSQFPSEEQIA